MSDVVFYVCEVAIKEGQLENFKAVMKEMVEATKANEPATMNYEWFIAPDGVTCHICERYANSRAVITHLMSIREKFNARYWATVEPKHFTVYGNPSDEVKKIFAALDTVYMAPLAGFAR
jgi:quinol monooxygenase YgiN